MVEERDLWASRLIKHAGKESGARDGELQAREQGVAFDGQVGKASRLSEGGLLPRMTTVWPTPPTLSLEKEFVQLYLSPSRLPVTPESWRKMGRGLSAKIPRMSPGVNDFLESVTVASTEVLTSSWEKREHLCCSLLVVRGWCFALSESLRRNKHTGDQYRCI